MPPCFGWRGFPQYTEATLDNDTVAVGIQLLAFARGQQAGGDAECTLFGTQPFVYKLLAYFFAAVRIYFNLAESAA